jgi:hypothetical protein
LEGGIRLNDSEPGLTNFMGSCEDKNTIESQITRCGEAIMAAIWKGMVCRMYNVDNWELVESGH